MAACSSSGDCNSTEVCEGGLCRGPGNEGDACSDEKDCNSWLCSKEEGRPELRGKCLPFGAAPVPKECGNVFGNWVDDRCQLPCRQFAEAHGADGIGCDQYTCDKQKCVVQIRGGAPGEKRWPQTSPVQLPVPCEKGSDCFFSGGCLKTGFCQTDLSLAQRQVRWAIQRHTHEKGFAPQCAKYRKDICRLELGLESNAPDHVKYKDLACDMYKGFIESFEEQPRYVFDRHPEPQGGCSNLEKQNGGWLPPAKPGYGGPCKAATDCFNEHDGARCVGDRQPFITIGGGHYKTCRRRGEDEDVCYNSADCNSWACTAPSGSKGKCAPKGEVMAQTPSVCFTDEECQKGIRDWANGHGWDSAANRYSCVFRGFWLFKGEGFCEVQDR